MSIDTATLPRDRFTVHGIQVSKNIVGSTSASNAAPSQGVFLRAFASPWIKVRLASVQEEPEIESNHFRSFAGLFLAIGIALMAIGLAASLAAGNAVLSTLFPIGATLLFIATIVASAANKGVGRDKRRRDQSG